jgi:hypothetical protein
MAGRLFFGSFCAALILAAASTWADVPPPKGYVEKCTIEAQTRIGEECRLCGAYFASREKCLALGREGYSQRCRSYGASVWSEVWCRLKPKPAGGALPAPGR